METQATKKTGAGMVTGGKTRVTENISAAQVARLAATLGVHDDDAPANASLKPGWHTVFCNAILNARDLAPDGLPGDDPVLPQNPDFPVRLFGGTDITFLKPVPVGATLTCESCIRAVTPKTGRAGPMLVLQVERRFLLGSETAIIENQSVIYKRDSSAPAAGAAVAEEEREAKEEVGIGEIEVFRFSALTFNSHRIHYDAPYTQGTEAKPGLLIQAKLTALHLLALCIRKAHGADPIAFSFRSVRPFYCPNTLCMGASVDESARTVSAWGTDSNGGTVMLAEMRY